MAIWQKAIDLAAINASTRGTLVEALGITITEVGDDWLRGTMPVDHRTKQPFGLLHGGASVALAETLGSFAGWMTLPAGQGNTVGLEINANHLRAMREGVVTGTARAVHVGRSTQVWEIRITDEREKLVCISRLTLAVVGPNVAPAG